MTVRRRLALGGGVLAAALGLAGAVDPTLLAGASVGDWALPLLGASALLYAAVPLYQRHAGDDHRASVPAPEPPSSPGPPGAELDRLLSGAATVGRGSVRRRRRLKRRLRTVAVDAVRRRENCSLEAAREALERGEWTDDPVAASYFTDGPVDLSGVSPARKVRLRFSPRARRRFGARRVAAAVLATTDPGGDP